jgi:hypothetical protein
MEEIRIPKNEVDTLDDQGMIEQASIMIETCERVGADHANVIFEGFPNGHSCEGWRLSFSVDRGLEELEIPEEDDIEEDEEDPEEDMEDEMEEEDGETSDDTDDGMDAEPEKPAEEKSDK